MVKLHGEGPAVVIQKTVNVEKDDVIEEKIEEFVVIFFPEFIGQENNGQSQDDQEEINQN
jgi:hypothetical protein